MAKIKLIVIDKKFEPNSGYKAPTKAEYENKPIKKAAHAGRILVSLSASLT